MHNNMLSYPIVVFYALLSTVTCQNIGKPQVTTLIGKINGHYKKSYGNRQYEAYEGIPYALPPIEDLRFKPPVPVNASPEPIEAINLPEPCSQYNQVKNLPYGTIEGQEDCLYLNIYTPAKNKTESLPVIFWIHGGNFQFGSGSDFRGKFILDRDVILVTVNYRLGPFGFLSTGNGVVPGNMGLKDQSLALRWVHENIQHFGGDPGRITLAGSSGTSVHYHYLSPLSKGLFQIGISFSGTALSRWAFTSDTSNTSKNLAKALNCSIDNSSKMIECLKKIPHLKILEAYQNLKPKFYFPYAMFPPVAEKNSDDYFINDSPKNIIEQGRVSDVPWITGVVSEEGLYITAGFALKEDAVENTDKNWEAIAPYMLHFINNIPEDEHAKLANLAKHHYFGNKNFSTNKDSVKNLTHMAGDDQIVTGSIKAAKLQASVNKSPVYFYYYTYKAAQSMSDYLSNTTENLGVCHGDDVLIILENDYIDPTTSDKTMLHAMLDFWTFVATTGTPEMSIPWPGVNASSNNFDYMHIAGPKNFNMQSNNNLGEIRFWEQIGL